MRRWVAIAVCLILGGGAAGLASAAVRAEATSGQMVTLGDDEAAARSAKVTILRGSAVGPRPAPVLRQRDPARWQIVGGRRLWLVDPVSKDVVSCTRRKTSTVGVREIRCTRGSIGRFRRSFGRGFRH